MITVLCALVFRYMPDVRIAWRNVWFGAMELDFNPINCLDRNNVVRRNS